MTYFKTDIKVYATVYVSAKDEDSAAEIIRSLHLYGIEVEGWGDGIPIGAFRSDDPDQPSLHIAPAMTLYTDTTKPEDMEADT